MCLPTSLVRVVLADHGRDNVLEVLFPSICYSQSGGNHDGFVHGSSVCALEMTLKYVIVWVETPVALFSALTCWCRDL